MGDKLKDIDQAIAQSFMSQISLRPMRSTGSTTSSLKPKFPKIKKVLVNGPATIVFWNDGTKNVVKKYDEDEYNLRQAILEAFYDKVTGMTKKDKKQYFDRILSPNSKKVIYVGQSTDCKIKDTNTDSKFLKFTIDGKSDDK